MKKDQKYARKLYDAQSSEYHEKRLDPKKGFFNTFVENPAMEKFAKPLVKGKKVLDLGCGSGLFTKELKKWKAKVIGVDISKKMIDIAKKENPSIEFFVRDASKTRFKKNTFDVVVSGLMVHYFKDLGEVFKEASKITKKNGYFIFSMMHPLRSATEKIDEAKGIFKIENYRKIKKIKLNVIMPDGRYANMYSYHHTFSDIINGLNDVGFIVERIEEPKADPKGKKYSKKYYNKLKKYPNFLVVKARKI